MALIQVKKCEMCGAEIPVPPKTREVACPVCGSTYDVYRILRHGPAVLGRLDFKVAVDAHPSPGVIHGPAGLGSWEFDVSEHELGFAGPYAPATVGPGEDFEVVTEIICFTAGCDFTGNSFQVKDLRTDELKATGTFTERFFNVPALKYGSRGRVTIKAPITPGNYLWWVWFPEQVSKQ